MARTQTHYKLQCSSSRYFLVVVIFSQEAVNRGTKLFSADLLMVLSGLIDPLEQQLLANHTLATVSKRGWGLPQGQLMVHSSVSMGHI